ncbi:FkbM family methyltransferase [bacterium]|nr:FkbM family methyltransferase [bacterium]
MSALSRSQYGEDLKLLARFNQSEGFFLEIGACDGLLYSNSYLFERLGWTGILVEADPQLAAQCQRNRPGSILRNVALVGPEKAGQKLPFTRVSGAEEHSGFFVPDSKLRLLRALSKKVEVETVEVDCTTTDLVLQDCQVLPGQICFCSIDVEGSEMEVLRGFNLSYWRPQVVLVENNRIWPDAGIQDYLEAAGYHWFFSTGVNDWYAPKRGFWGDLRSRLRLWFQITPRRALLRLLHRTVLKLKGLA